MITFHFPHKIYFLLQPTHPKIPYKKHTINQTGTCLKATHLIPNCSVQKNEFQCQKCALGHTLSPNNESCESHQANTIYRNCSMISSITCSQFQNIYKDWFLMHRKKPFEIQDNIFFKELRRTRSQGDITIPEIYEQIVLSRKENISRVRLVGTGVKFKQTLKENVSSHCDVYVSDNEFFDQNQADLMANSVVQKSLFGSFAFRVFEEVENDPFFEEKIVCRKDFVIKIDLCQEYLNNFQCRRCSAMHFFQNNQCNLHAVIGNCLQYSHSIPQHCENCESGFYFDQGLKTCESRTKLLNNCSEKDPYSGMCIYEFFIIYALILIVYKLKLFYSFFLFLFFYLCFLFPLFFINTHKYPYNNPYNYKYIYPHNITNHKNSPPHYIYPTSINPPITFRKMPQMRHRIPAQIQLRRMPPHPQKLRTNRRGLRPLHQMQTPLLPRHLFLLLLPFTKNRKMPHIRRPNNLPSLRRRLRFTRRKMRRLCPLLFNQRKLRRNLIYQRNLLVQKMRFWLHRLPSY